MATVRGQELISLKEAGDMVGHSRAWVHQAVNRIKGFPKAVRYPGGRPYLIKSEVEAWLDAQLARR
jgi:predicted DNA-binding transcriptional regulator AlpA